MRVNSGFQGPNAFIFPRLRPCMLFHASISVYSISAITTLELREFWVLVYAFRTVDEHLVWNLADSFSPFLSATFLKNNETRWWKNCNRWRRKS